VFSVVPHHKDVAAGHDHIERDGRRLGLRAVRTDCQIGGFVQRLAVDSEAIIVVATEDVISRQSDNPLDQMLGAGVGQYADKLKRLADWAALAGGTAREPASWVGEDCYLPSLDAAQLLDQDAIIDLERVLHRNRRDQEQLANKSPQQ
jgi:hypothetical protein